ncbi:MAG: dihydrolipoamide acetyltransferase family protein [Hyphomicrobiaceae bacterium]|nr:dihydrolipoamide acetyltransferase family protein [Hyphomicrobiaceae bacterium]
MTTFLLPDLGEGLTEAEIVSWHVGTGDRVIADQPMVSVETAKAVVEIPAPWSGRIARTFGVPGDVILIGAPLAEFETGGETADAGAVVGTLPGAAPPATRAPPPGAPVLVPAAGSPSTATPSPLPHGRASPAVRKRAAELGIDIAAISGTGPGGAITMSDLDKGGAPLAALGDGYAPLTGVRRAMADAMTSSASQVVSASVTDEAIIDAWPADADPTIRLARAIVAGCRAAPELNAWLDGKRKARRLHPQVDLGIAMETADGLFVPVLRDVASRKDADLRAGLEAMKRDVANRSVPLAELRGQTITLSNFGMLGGRHAVLAVMPPQVAILGAGRIEPAVRVVEGEMRIVRVLPLSLTFDHRAVTGAEAMRFLSAAIAELSG